MSSKPQHIVVIGAGAVGASVSYFLSKKDPNLKITVVEKTGVAQAASGKSGGFLALDWSDLTELGPISRKSFKLHEELAKELDGKAYGYRRVSTYGVQMAATKVAKKSSKIAWLDTEKVEEINTMGTTKTTAQVHPYKFTNALIDDAKKRGVKVRCGQGVKSLSWDDSKNRLTGVVLDDDSIIECDAAIVCMGPWSAELPIKSNRSQRGRLPIIAARAHSIVLKPKRDVPAQALFCSMQAGRKFYDPETDDEPLPPSAAEVKIKQESIDILHQLAAVVSPTHLADAELIASQACYLPTSKDGLPLIGEHPSVHRVYVATGHSCWGILNSPVTGLMMSELIVDGSISCVDQATVTAVSPKGRC
ncbi:hypothetical protein Unana1_02887 [Umbelopsis nana]